MPGLKRIYRSITLLLILITGYSCSVEKNTNMSRFYHNLSSHYNIYFNGYESYREGLARISSSNRDDYSAIMPIFEYSNPDAAQSAFSDMERVIQKCSKVISFHSLTARPEVKNSGQMSDKEKEFYSRKDYNNWIDDSYLLMGKAQLLQQKREEARITLMHNIRESDNRDIRDESSIWLARANAEMANFGEAARILQEMDPASLAQELVPEYYLTLSDIQLKQERYNDATAPLSLALEKMKGKEKKARLTFILARLYEETGNAREAENRYREVLKLNPSYEMEFNAMINQAGVFDVENGDVVEINRELNKLLKDAKNKEYKDQIYYAMGNLALREGNIEDAIEYMKLSAAASSTNTTQKGRSYLVLGSYYFDLPDYSRSQVYYDSAVTFLSEDYPGYQGLYEKSINLNELAGYLNTIEREDSLQYVASLPAPRRDMIISGIIRKIEQEEREAESDLNQRYNMGEFYENQRRFQGNIEESGKWYFYNQSALTFGRSEFRNRWGERRLEDNWRRMNKSRINNPSMGENPDALATTDTSGAVTNRKSAEFYLRDLPLTDSLMKISNDRIAGSLFNAGRVFQERIVDIPEANRNYQSLVTRFPGHEYVPQALYNLYRINRDTDPSLAESYKSRLITDFPLTEYAMILSDPDYFNTRLAEGRAAERLYNEAFVAWKKDETALASELCDRGIAEYPGSELEPKFRLLKAYSIARTVDERSLKDELVRIGEDFPGTVEAKRAAELIEYLNREIPELKVEEEQIIARQLYSQDLTGEHHFIVIIKNRSLDINRLTFDIINFNIDNYTNENYSSRGELVKDSYLMITVGPFENREQATEYYKRFNPGEIMSAPADVEILKFIITGKNLETLRQETDPDRYYLFFRDNYSDLY